jgi:hypothetical protein
MASMSPGLFPPPQSSGGPIAPHHYRSPTPRELRAQAAHRLQIGILGLASMLLLVGLANIIMDRARVNDQAAAVAALPTATPLAADPADAGGDPLADIGVVPDLPAGKGKTSPGTGAAAGGNRVTR